MGNPFSGLPKYIQAILIGSVVLGTSVATVFGINRGDVNNPGLGTVSPEPKKISTKIVELNVRDNETRENLGSVDVEVETNRGPNPVEKTDDGGYVSLEIPTQEEVRISLRKNGYLLLNRSIDLRLDNRVKYTFYMEKEVKGDSEQNSSSSSSLINLSGVWNAEGFTCPADVLIPSETIEIEHIGKSLIARKIEGDDCIRSGEITFKGEFDGKRISTIPVDLHVTTAPNIIYRDFVEALLEVKNEDYIELVYQGAKIEFSRISNSE